MTITINNLREKLPLFAAFIAGIGIPISTALENIGVVLLVISFLFKPSLCLALKHAVTKPFAIAGITLGVALAIGTLWSSAPAPEAWAFVRKMHTYYLIPIFLIIFSIKNVRFSLFAGFGLATLATILLSIISASMDNPILHAAPNDWSMFRTHTYHNFFASLLAISLLSGLLAQCIPKKYRWLAAVIFLLTSYDILFLVSGRTGQIIFLLMIGTVLVLWKPLTGMLLNIILVGWTLIILPHCSSVIQQGISSVSSNIESYQSNNVETAVGLRLEFYENSLKLIKGSPLVGYGTGSFLTEYRKLTNLYEGMRATKNPHNDYFMLAIQLGFIGPLLLLGLLSTALWQGRNLLPYCKWTLYSILAGMGGATLANSFFMDNITRVAFILLVSALLNSPKQELSHD